MDGIHQYEGMNFIINEEEDPCGFVAVDHVTGVRKDDGVIRYRVERLGLDGKAVHAITLDESDIDARVASGILRMRGDKETALTVARKQISG